MGRTYDSIDDDLAGWVEAQPMWFVATAPRSTDGMVNVSPKGGDLFRVIDPHTVAYLDLTGSGIETIAHLRENGRLTIMFCSFDDKPRIVRFHGHGDWLVGGDPEFDTLRDRFPDLPGARGVIRLQVRRISTSCGFGVPIMDLVGARPTLHEWAERKGADGLADYQATKNQHSLDGLPALADPPETPR